MWRNRCSWLATCEGGPCKYGIALQDFEDRRSGSDWTPEVEHLLLKTFATQFTKLSDFIHWVEQTFQLAYGKEGMSIETLKYASAVPAPGLHYDIINAPAVSGAHGYQQLCLAQEMRKSALGSWGSNVSIIDHLLTNQTEFPGASGTQEGGKPMSGTQSSGDLRRYFKCVQPGHLARKCHAKNSESQGSKVRNSTSRSGLETR